MHEYIYVRPIVILCAFRYALRCHSGLAETICEEIEKMLLNLDRRTLGQLEQEIDDADERLVLGMSCDRQRWLLFRANIRRERAKRNEPTLW